MRESSSLPSGGWAGQRPQVALSQVDLQELRSRMQAAFEHARAELERIESLLLAARLRERRSLTGKRAPRDRKPSRPGRDPEL